MGSNFRGTKLSRIAIFAVFIFADTGVTNILQRIIEKVEPVRTASKNLVKQ